jgi:hypothetical protein
MTEMLENPRGKLYQGLDQALAEELDETVEGEDLPGTAVDPDIALD